MRNAPLDWFLYENTPSSVWELDEDGNSLVKETYQMVVGKALAATESDPESYLRLTLLMSADSIYANIPHSPDTALGIANQLVRLWYPSVKDMSYAGPDADEYLADLTEGVASLVEDFIARPEATEAVVAVFLNGWMNLHQEHLNTPVKDRSIRLDTSFNHRFYEFLLGEVVRSPLLTDFGLLSDLFGKFLHLSHWTIVPARRVQVAFFLNGNLPAEVACGMMAEWFVTSPDIKVGKEAKEHLREELAVLYPDLAGLPDRMLIETVGSLPAPARWKVWEI